MLGSDDGNGLGPGDGIIEGLGDGNILGTSLGPDDGRVLGPDDGSVDGSREGTKLGSVLGPDAGGVSLCLTGVLVGGLSVISPSLGEALGNDIDGWAVRSYLCDIKIA